MNTPDWIDTLFYDKSGFLKANRAIVLNLMERDDDIRSKTRDLFIDRDRAEIIAVPTKRLIASTNSVSLSHVQNVHRVMRETAVLLAGAQIKH